MIYLAALAPVTGFAFVTGLANPAPNPLTIGTDTEFTVDVSVTTTSLVWASTQVFVDGQPYACVQQPDPAVPQTSQVTEAITVPVMAPLDQAGTYAISVEDYEDLDCTSTGAGNDFSVDIEVVEAPIPTATFAVSKAYSDGNPDSVDVTLTCNSGIPLEQNFTISEGNPVNFVVQHVQPGTECEVTENGSAVGYTPSYDTGGVSPSATSCLFEDVADGQYECTITNVLDEVVFNVHAVWEFDTEVDAFPTDLTFDFYCENFRISPNGTLEDQSGTFILSPDVPSTVGLFYPNYTTPVTRCRFDVSSPASGVEVDDGCADWTNMVPGDETVSCTVTATVFYEGIPTLSPAALAMLALLMLGMGFYGFRRWA